MVRQARGRTIFLHSARLLGWQGGRAQA